MMALSSEPLPGSAPGTLVLDHGRQPDIYVIDYSGDNVIERKLSAPDDVLEYLNDDRPSL